MQIWVLTLTQKCFALDVEPEDLIDSIHQRIFEECMKNFPIESQFLIFRGEILQNGRTLQQYDIIQDSRLHLVCDFNRNNPVPTKQLDFQPNTPTQQKLLAEFVERAKPYTIFQAGNNVLAQVTIPNSPYDQGYFYVWAQADLNFVTQDAFPMKVLTPFANSFILCDPQFRGHGIESYTSATGTIGDAFAVLSGKTFPKRRFFATQIYRRKKDLLFNPIILSDNFASIQEWGRKWTEICALDQIDFGNFTSEMEAAPSFEAKVHLFYQILDYVEETYQQLFWKKVLSLIPGSPIFNTLFNFLLSVNRVFPDFPLDLKKVLSFHVLAVHKITTFWDLIIFK